MSRKWVAVLVACVAFAVYANTLGHGFVVDDHYTIQGNAWGADVSRLGEVFTHGVWDFQGARTNYYRPMMYVSYLAVYRALGPEPWGYHLLNVLLHAAASVMVLLIGSRVLARERTEISRLAFAGAAALLFAVHPIHTEAVAWVGVVVDLGSSLFCLVSLYLYICSAERGTRWRLPLAALSFLVATLYKESALTFPLVLVAYEWAFRRESFSVRTLARRLSPFAIALAVHLALRIPALGGFAPGRSGAAIGRWQQLLAALDLFSRYLEKLVAPVDLNFWHVYVAPASLASPGMVRALAIDAAFAAVAVLAFRMRGAALVGVTALVAPLLPALYAPALNQGISSAFTERYLYLPSFGAILLVLAGADALLARRPAAARGLAAALAAVLVVFAVGTVRRNPVWKDELSIWSDAVRKSPESARAHANLGFALAAAGRAAEGLGERRRAIALDPEVSEVEISRGIAYAAAGRTANAILVFHAALALDPLSSRAHYHLARTYEQTGSRAQALAEYEAALRLDPSSDAAHNDLGVLYAQAGRIDQALPHFRAAAQLRPESAAYRANLEAALAR